MSLQIYIRAQMKRIVDMVTGKDQRTVRFSPAVADAIDQLVTDGKYSSFTDFVNRAVHEMLCKEDMDDRIRKLVRDEVKKALDNSTKLS